MIRPAIALLVGWGLLAGCESSLPVTANGVVVGTWGGDDGGLIADDTSGHTHIGCTYGNVHRPIVADAQGHFDVAGEYNITAYPVDRGIFHPALFTGSVGGRTMTLTVTLSDTAVVLGPVHLTFGREPRMQVCPICRRAPGGR